METTRTRFLFVSRKMPSKIDVLLHFTRLERIHIGSSTFFCRFRSQECLVGVLVGASAIANMSWAQLNCVYLSCSASGKTICPCGFCYNETND